MPILQRLVQRVDCPMQVSFGITETCNLSCPHCFQTGGRLAGDLTFDEVLRILDDLQETGVLYLCITGGEPLMHPRCLDIIGAAVDRRFVVSMKTNGTILEPHEAATLSRLGLAQLDLSFYHGDAAEHDRFVGREGAFSRAMSLADAFAEVGGRVKINTTAMSWNTPQGILALRTLADDKDFDFSVSPFAFPRRDGGVSPTMLNASVEQLELLFRAMPELVGAGLDVSALRRSGDSTLCGAGNDGPHVGPNGDLFLCQRLSEPLGNLRKQRFLDIWESSPARHAMLNRRWRETESCNDCECSGLCNFCPATAMVESGSYFGVPSLECRIAKLRERMLLERDDPSGS